LVFDHDDADPQRDFFADQGIGEDEERDFSRPAFSGSGGRRPLSEFDRRFRDRERPSMDERGRSYAGRGPRNYHRSDASIYEEVCMRMTVHGQLDASDIEVTVENGEVTLQGSVRERRSKRLAEDIADRVSGVQDVHNRLSIHKASHQDFRWGMGDQDEAGVEEQARRSRGDDQRRE